MTGILALVGGGEFSAACTGDADLLAAAGTDSVVVLPTAAAFEHPDRVGEAARRHFAGLGATVDVVGVVARPDARSEELAARVRSARFIYLSGGSPMHLRSVLKETPVLEALVAAWQGGAVVAAAGEAAATLVDPMVDARGGAFTLGLGILAPLAVMPHHETWSPDRSHRTLQLAPKGCPVLAIDTGAMAVRAGDGTWTTSGIVAVSRDGAPADLEVLP